MTATTEQKTKIREYLTSIHALGSTKIHDIKFNGRDVFARAEGGMYDGQNVNFGDYEDVLDRADRHGEYADSGWY